MAVGNRGYALALLVLGLALAASAEEAHEEAASAESAQERAAPSGAEEAAPSGDATGRPEQVGKPPDQEPETRPEVTTLTEVGGVLTERGTLRIEPTLEFTHTSFNRFNVRGFEIVQGAVLIGTIEAFESDRDTLIQAVTMRYGLTNRFEVDATVAGVYRDERFINTIPVAGSSTENPTITSRSISEYGLGDIEAGLHYQVNSGADGWPYLVGNLRVKSDTGTGPFDVSRDAAGIETELPTGSGYWSLGPSLTLISPQGPAVLYGNLGYLWNLEPDVDEQITATQRVTQVDPGDAITMNLGLGLAVTQDLSFNLGFDYSFIRPTETDIINPTTTIPITSRFSSSDLQVGSLVLGLGYRFSPSLAAQVNVAIGATEDAPDFRVSLRWPISLSLFDY